MLFRSICLQRRGTARDRVPLTNTTYDPKLFSLVGCCKLWVLGFSCVLGCQIVWRSADLFTCRSVEWECTGTGYPQYCLYSFPVSDGSDDSQLTTGMSSKLLTFALTVTINILGQGDALGNHAALLHIVLPPHSHTAILPVRLVKNKGAGAGSYIQPASAASGPFLPGRIRLEAPEPYRVPPSCHTALPSLPNRSSQLLKISTWHKTKPEQTAP